MSEKEAKTTEQREVKGDVSQRAIIQIEVELNENMFTFLMPMGIPLQDCYDAGALVLQEIINISKQQKKLQEERMEEKEAKKEK